MDEESQDLFVFYTPWGLYKYNILVMGVSSASSECHERIRVLVEGLEGVQQIKDDIVVHGDGKEHDSRLEALLERLAEIECPALGLVLCHPGWQGLGVGLVHGHQRQVVHHHRKLGPVQVHLVAEYPRQHPQALSVHLPVLQLCLCLGDKYHLVSDIYIVKIPTSTKLNLTSRLS